jgi:hypothetical protein
MISTGMASALDSWHHCIVPKEKVRDFFAIARRVVEQAIGEQMDGTPLEDADAGKNPAAVALGKLGELRPYPRVGRYTA